MKQIKWITGQIYIIIAIVNKILMIVNKSSRKEESKVNITTTSNAHSKLGNGGQMVMNNMNVNPYGMMNPNMGNMNMPPYMFNNPMGMQPPMYNYMGNPINPVQMMYNPYANGTPVNNYNRNLSSNFNNFNSNPINTPINPYNINMNNNMSHLSNNLSNINHNQPIKILNSPTIPIDNNNSKQRAMSSKHMRANNEDNFQNNVSNLNNKSNSYYNEKTHPDSSRRQRGNSIEGAYQPYSLKEYKELSRAKIVLGGLGANIGTKEWEEKQQKMKKIQNYGKSVTNNNLQNIKIKKETPQDIIDRKKKEEIERSNRYKAHKYADLIKPKKYETISDNQEVEDNKLKFMMDYHTQNTINKSNRTNSNNNLRYNGNNANADSQNNSINDELASIQRKREDYLNKINEIKESLINQNKAD